MGSSGDHGNEVFDIKTSHTSTNLTFGHLWGVAAGDQIIDGHELQAIRAADVFL
ncbi:hypothetical protein AOX55_0000809 [Sinorhizobium fredii CCBAU 25509]|nr:hypothetical protein AOX55_0000809 [Sinorhizobium fredii CCBAU 25509]